jgi:hypothetical protein
MCVKFDNAVSSSKSLDAKALLLPHRRFPTLIQADGLKFGNAGQLTQ